MKLRWHGDKITKQVREQSSAALNRAAEGLLTEANKSVPHQEGTLERSGQVNVDKKEMEASVSYDTPYALRLHESPEFNFRGKGRGKWLELTTQEQAKNLKKFLVAELEKAFR